MKHYELSAKSLYYILERKKVEYLYHANTVATSITFINNDALMSRKFVEEHGLGQTPQASDELDKKYDVWDHVFVDGLDLHNKYNRNNSYGPVLFRLKLAILLSPAITGVYITRNNPLYWKDSMPLEQRYYSNIEEFEQDYLTGKMKVDARIMITIRSPDRRIKLKGWLDSVILDKPTRLILLPNSARIAVGNYAFEKIKEAMQQNGLGHIPLTIRHDGESLFKCWCVVNYTNMNGNTLKEKFSANIPRNELPPDKEDTKDGHKSESQLKLN